MKVAGIDCSTVAIDVVLLDLDSDMAEWISFDLDKKLPLIDRLRVVGTIMGRTWSIWDDVTGVGIERPMKRGHGSAHSAMAFGATLTRIPDWMMVKEWTPSEWRTGCDMKGNASKDEVAEWVAVTAIQDGGDHRAMFDNQNACDAYAIAYATRAALETVPSIALSPAQATLLGDDNPTPVPSKGAVT